jgi:hypothetical protein
LIGGGNTLFFIAKTYSSWELTFATDSNSSDSSVGSSSSVTLTWTAILETRQNWHNHLPNKTYFEASRFFRMDSSIRCYTSVSLSRIPPWAFLLVNGHARSFPNGFPHKMFYSFLVFILNTGPAHRSVLKGAYFGCQHEILTFYTTIPFPRRLPLKLNILLVDSRVCCFAQCALYTCNLSFQTHPIADV